MMKRISELALQLMMSATLPACLFCFAAFLPFAAAQSGTAGQNAICTSLSSCSGTAVFGSSAFIDTMGFVSPGRDFCGVLNVILNTGYPAAGAVIDARGLPGTTGTSMTCAASPWGSGTGYVNKPSTILLPAAVITIPGAWILPNGSALIGENSRLPGGINIGAPNATTLLACTTSICTTGFSDSTMLQFGDSHCPTSGCRGISVDGLALNGNGLTINGITNAYAQERSYVDHVTLYQLLGVGLQISAGADNSGPYSNITFDTGTFPPSFSSTACASINGTGGTRGIHGLSCIGESANGSVGVYLDSSNNTLDDIRIIGYDDGIRVGSQAVARVEL